MTTYRPPQPAPTEPGWYYGRREDGHPIAPLEVVLGNLCQELVVRYPTEGLYPLHLVDWFGPVPICKEG